MNPPNRTILRKEWASNSGEFGWFCTVPPWKVSTGIMFGDHGSEKSIDTILNAVTGGGAAVGGDWFRYFK